MSDRLPASVDPERIAASGQRLGGVMALSGMTRLLALLVAEEGAQASLMAECRLAIFRDEAGRLCLEGEVQARLPLQCQRCLEPVTTSIRTEFSLAVVENEAEAEALPETLDPCFREQRLIHLPSLVEDELIVALPQVARHADPARCGPIGQDEALLPPGQLPAEETGAEKAVQRPFRHLAALKGLKGREDK